MTKTASQRRFDKLVAELGDLRANHPRRFHIVWQNYFRGWVDEALRRAAAQRQFAAAEPIPAIFALLDKAERLARDLGAETEPAVRESLLHLRHVCARAVAGVTNPKLYRFHKDCTYRLREQFVRNRSRD